MRIERKVIIERDSGSSLTLEPRRAGGQRDEYEAVEVTVRGTAERGIATRESITVPLAELREAVAAVANDSEYRGPG